MQGLEAVKWSELESAYGPATEVPALLQRVADFTPEDDADERLAVWDDLINLINHQDTVYEVSSHAVSFLFQVLETPSHPDSFLVAYVLHGLATGAPMFGQNDQFMREVLERQGEDYDHAVEKAEHYVAETREAVRKHVDVLLSLLSDDEADLRGMAAKIASVFLEGARQSAPVIRRRLEDEADPQVQVALIRALRALVLTNGDLEPAERQSYAGVLRDLLDDEHARAVQVAAAHALVVGLDVDAPDAALRLTVEAGRSSDELLDEAYYGESISVEEICTALGTLGPSQSIPLLLDILGDNTLSSEELLDHVVETLLDVVFGAPAQRLEGRAYAGDRLEYWDASAPEGHMVWPKIRDELSTQQVEVLQAIVEEERVWQMATNLFEMYGLPTERDVLRALANES